MDGWWLKSFYEGIVFIRWYTCAKVLPRSICPPSKDMCPEIWFTQYTLSSNFAMLYDERFTIWKVYRSYRMHSIDSTAIMSYSKPQVFVSFNLPWQHLLLHYIKLICAYGVPNGLCSSIMESRHIKKINSPYIWSNLYNALGQMLLMNQHCDKLTACCLICTYYIYPWLWLAKSL